MPKFENLKDLKQFIKNYENKFGYKYLNPKLASGIRCYDPKENYIILFNRINSVRSAYDVFLNTTKNEGELSWVELTGIDKIYIISEQYHNTFGFLCYEYNIPFFDGVEFIILPDYNAKIEFKLEFMIRHDDFQYNSPSNIFNYKLSIVNQKVFLKLFYKHNNLRKYYYHGNSIIKMIELIKQFEMLGDYWGDNLTKYINISIYGKINPNYYMDLYKLKNNLNIKFNKVTIKYIPYSDSYLYKQKFNNSYSIAENVRSVGILALKPFIDNINLNYPKYFIDKNTQVTCKMTYEVNLFIFSDYFKYIINSTDINTNYKYRLLSDIITWFRDECVVSLYLNDLEGTEYYDYFINELDKSGNIISSNSKLHSEFKEFLGDGNE